MFALNMFELEEKNARDFPATQEATQNKNRILHPECATRVVVDGHDRLAVVNGISSWMDIFPWSTVVYTTMN